MHVSAWLLYLWVRVFMIKKNSKRDDMTAAYHKTKDSSCHSLFVG